MLLVLIRSVRCSVSDDDNDDDEHAIQDFMNVRMLQQLEDRVEDIVSQDSPQRCKRLFGIPVVK